MKSQKTIVTLIALLALAAQQQARAIVGYVNYQFQAGPNLFGNPLHNQTDALSLVIATAPEGTSIMSWNPASLSYNQAAIFSGGAWVGNPVLTVGTAALLVAPNPFLNTFIGEVVGAVDPIQLPPPFAGPNGLYLWNNKIPISGTGAGAYSLFELVVGRTPNDNEAFHRWNGSSFDTLTYMGGGWFDSNYNQGFPSLNVGEAGFFDIGGTGALPSVPEPGSLTILVFGLFGWRIARRFRCRA